MRQTYCIRIHMYFYFTYVKSSKREIFVESETVRKIILRQNKFNIIRKNVCILNLVVLLFWDFSKNFLTRMFKVPPIE